MNEPFSMEMIMVTIMTMEEGKQKLNFIVNVWQVSDERAEEKR